MALQLAANLLGKSGVDGVTRTYGDYMPLERTSDESYVAENVEELVSCRLIVEVQRSVVDISEFTHVLMWNAHSVGNFVEFFLSEWRVVDYDSIVEVATLD